MCSGYIFNMYLLVTFFDSLRTPTHMYMHTHTHTHKHTHIQLSFLTLNSTAHVFFKHISLPTLNVICLCILYILFIH